MVFDLTRFALTNLFRSRGRLIITASGVVIGTCAVILLIALTIGLQQSAEAGVGDNEALTEIIVYPDFQTLDPSEDVPLITLASVQQMDALEGVLATVPLLPLFREAELRQGQYINTLPVYGVQPNRLSYLEMNIVQGNLDAIAENEMIVGEMVDDTFIDSRSDETWINVPVDLYASSNQLIIRNFEGRTIDTVPIMPRAIIATADNQYNNAIFLPFETVLALNNSINGEVLPPEDIIFNQLFIRTTGRQATLNVVQQIEELGFATNSLGNYLEQLNNFFTLMRLILGGVGFVALIIAAFGVANTMMMAIIERTAEIGLMKAIGARDSEVLLIFLIEAGLVGLVGGAIGAWLALFLEDRINTFITDSATNTQLSVLINAADVTSDLVVIPNQLIIFAVVLATLVGLAAGFFPALRASRLSPVAALKYE